MNGNTLLHLLGILSLASGGHIMVGPHETHSLRAGEPLRVGACCDSIGSCTSLWLLTMFTVAVSGVCLGSTGSTGSLLCVFSSHTPCDSFVTFSCSFLCRSV